MPLMRLCDISCMYVVSRRFCTQHDSSVLQVTQTGRGSLKRCQRLATAEYWNSATDKCKVPKIPISVFNFRIKAIKGTQYILFIFLDACLFK